MTAEIQRAESAIKDGDTKTAFEILRNLLTENPDSERAWWVMSGLVPRAQRATCLEQVLRINPDNQMARETLDKLLSSPAQPETKPPRQIPTPPAKKPSEKSYLQTFIYDRGSHNYLTILDDKRLIRATVKTDDLINVKDTLQRGEIPDRYLSEMKTIPLSLIESVRQKGSALQVTYLDGNTERALRLAFKDQPKAKVVLGILTKKLGPSYLIQTRPLNTGLNLGFSALLTLGAIGFSAWVLWGVQQISISPGTNRENFTLAAGLLDSLGSIGTLLLCGAAILVALGISAWLLLKPPVATELVRRN